MDTTRRQSQLGRGRFLVVLLALVMSAGMACCGPMVAPSETRQSWPSHLGLIYYSERDGAENLGALYLRDLESGEEWRLTERGEVVTPYTTFDWSQAAGRLVYASGPHGHREIYTVDLKGEHRQRLTHNDDVEDYFPKWSPDGSRIAFARQEGKSGDSMVQAYVMNADDSDIRRILDDPNIYSGPGVWSPDGQHIAVDIGNLYDVKPADIVVLEVNSAEEVARISDGLDHSILEWSPDGTRLAFTATDRYASGNYPLQLYIVDLPAANPVRLSDLKGVVSVSWSPDSRRLAFSGPPDATCGIYLVNADGTNLREIKEPLVYAIGGEWSPDGKQVAFAGVSASEDFFDLYIMDVESWTVRRTTR